MERNELPVTRIWKGKCMVMSYFVLRLTTGIKVPFLFELKERKLRFLLNNCYWCQHIPIAYILLDLVIGEDFVDWYRKLCDKKFYHNAYKRYIWLRRSSFVMCIFYKSIVVVVTCSNGTFNASTYQFNGFMPSIQYNFIRETSSWHLRYSH